MHDNYMQMHLLQVHVRWPSMAKLDEDVLDAWRAFLTAHAHVTRAISRDLAEAGLPDLSWYDLLWALYRHPERRLRGHELAPPGGACASTSSPARSCGPRRR